MRLKDKVAIVTGAASGIGRATAILFAREGARLVLNDLDSDGLEGLKKQIAGEATRTIVGNVADEGISRQPAQQAISAFGHIDILVNNAGVHLPELGMSANAGGDFFFVEASDAHDAARKLIEIIRNRIPNRFGFDPIRDVQAMISSARELPLRDSPLTSRIE